MVFEDQNPGQCLINDLRIHCVRLLFWRRRLSLPGEDTDRDVALLALFISVLMRDPKSIEGLTDRRLLFGSCGLVRKYQQDR